MGSKTRWFCDRCGAEVDALGKLSKMQLKFATRATGKMRERLEAEVCGACVTALGFTALDEAYEKLDEASERMWTGKSAEAVAAAEAGEARARESVEAVKWRLLEEVLKPMVQACVAQEVDEVLRPDVG